MSELALPFGALVRRPNEDTTPLIYRGGKSRIASWVIGYFPPHTVFVDVFGGGAAISLAKSSSAVDVYNDIGDVSRFFEVLRDYGDELYRFLTFYPFSRQAFFHACKQRRVLEGTVFPSWDVPEYEEANRHYKIRWAAFYYVSILQSFRHEEDDTSWRVSKGVNTASAFASHVDAFPQAIDRLRRTIIENDDCLSIISRYDHRDTLFYCDPPYVPETRNMENGYKHEMTREQHIQLLDVLLCIKGQCVLSGYPCCLYDRMLIELGGWDKVTKMRRQGIRNASQAYHDRTEILWIKRHQNELWEQAPSNVSGVPI